MTQHLWWMSFVGKDDKFRGVSLVWAIHSIEAIKVAWALGVNPGGSIMSHLMDDKVAALVPARWIERLLSKKECEEMEAEMKPLVDGLK